MYVCALRRRRNLHRQLLQRGASAAVLHRNHALELSGQRVMRHQLCDVHLRRHAAPDTQITLKVLAGKRMYVVPARFMHRKGQNM